MIQLLKGLGLPPRILATDPRRGPEVQLTLHDEPSTYIR